MAAGRGDRAARVDKAPEAPHAIRVGIRQGIAWLALGATLVACGSDDDHQRLTATGTLLDGEGNPLAGSEISRYDLTFVLNGEEGPVSIQRSFDDDGTGSPLITDANGRFHVTSNDLALAYDYQRDEWVCEDVCTAWETVCYEVTEEVCLDTCAEDQCWDECWDDCDVDCYDETVCDEYGDCWTETVCDESCTEVCDTVCETVAYPCNCYLETYDQCDDECVQIVEECGWVTRTYTAFPALNEISTTEAELQLTDGTWISGVPIEAFQQDTCQDDGKCELVNLWVQKDLFTVESASTSE